MPCGRRPIGFKRLQVWLDVNSTLLAVEQYMKPDIGVPHPPGSARRDEIEDHDEPHSRTVSWGPTEHLYISCSYGIFPVLDTTDLINAEPDCTSKSYRNYCRSDEYPEWLTIFVQLLEIHSEDRRSKVQWDVDECENSD